MSKAAECSPSLPHKLGIPVHRAGYKYLCVALAIYSKENPPFFTKELYPAVAKKVGLPDWRAVEHGIRQVIIAGWKHGDKTLWNEFFPGLKKPPSNKHFIATLAEFL